MNEKVERVLGALDGFRMADEMTSSAYSSLYDAISELDDLLKAQELPTVKPEKSEEITTKWLDTMTAEQRLDAIAAILDDWDGYRTAKGLGELINEVWAYALYPVKAQEPKKPEVIMINGNGIQSGSCPCCGETVNDYYNEKYCGKCGQRLRWLE